MTTKSASTSPGSWMICPPFESCNTFSLLALPSESNSRSNVHKMSVSQHQKSRATHNNATSLIFQTLSGILDRREVKVPHIKSDESVQGHLLSNYTSQYHSLFSLFPSSIKPLAHALRITTIPAYPQFL